MVRDMREKRKKKVAAQNLGGKECATRRQDIAVPFFLTVLFHITHEALRETGTTHGLYETQSVVFDIIIKLYSSILCLFYSIFEITYKSLVVGLSFP